MYTFEVTVSEKVGVDAAKLAGAVKGFKLERANTELVGDASKDESGGWWLNCRGSGQKLKIAAGAKDDGVKAIEAGVGEGKKTFKVAGELKTEKRKDGDKEVDVAVIAVATASAL